MTLQSPTTLIFGPLASARCLLRGLALLRQPRLRRYIWLPLIVNLTLYSAGFWFASHYFSAIMDWLIPSWLDWLRWLLWPLFGGSLLLAAFFTFTLVTNLIGSPFYGRLAEQVQEILGIPTAGSTAQGIGQARAMTESLVSEANRMLYFTLRALPMLGLFLIPGANLAAPFLWMLFGAWALGLEYMSYPLEARGLLFGAQRNLMKKRRIETLAFGGAVMFGLSIPILNVLIPPAAVIGATLYLAERERITA
jgi:CysZ protein